MTATTLTDRKNAAISRGVGMTTQIYADRAENAEIWDKEGRRYIDFASGIAVVNTGHRHPRVIAAVKEQLDRFTHTCHQVVPYESYVHLAERLNALTPGDFAKKTMTEERWHEVVGRTAHWQDGARRQCNVYRITPEGLDELRKRG